MARGLLPALVEAKGKEEGEMIIAEFLEDCKDEARYAEFIRSEAAAAAAAAGGGGQGSGSADASAAAASASDAQKFKVYRDGFDLVIEPTAAAVHRGQNPTLMPSGGSKDGTSTVMASSAGDASPAAASDSHAGSDQPKTPMTWETAMALATSIPDGTVLSS